MFPALALFRRDGHSKPLSPHLSALFESPRRRPDAQRHEPEAGLGGNQHPLQQRRASLPRPGGQQDRSRHRNARPSGEDAAGRRVHAGVRQHPRHGGGSGADGRRQRRGGARCGQARCGWGGHGKDGEAVSRCVGRAAPMPQVVGHRLPHSAGWTLIETFGAEALRRELRRLQGEGLRAPPDLGIYSLRTSRN